MRIYETDEIKIAYDTKRCIHAARCVGGLGEVFDPKAKPWVQPDKAATDEVAHVITLCPTGALQFERKDGGAEEQPANKNRVQLVADGPLYVRGDLQIVDREGNVVWEDTRMALCRCGASEIKPFCDNSHKKAEFHASGSVAGQPIVHDGQGGAVTINPLPDGPVMVRGNVEIVGDDGAVIFRGDKAALCRCGASMNKPFCDGTHRTVGFTGGIEGVVAKE